MYIIESVARLVLLFAKAIYIVFIEAINILHAHYAIVSAIWIALSFIMNVLCIVKVNLKKHLILPVVNLMIVNLILIATFIENEWLCSVKVVFTGADVEWKLLVWIQTACAMICTGLIIYILNIFRHPDIFQSKINKHVLMISVISQIVTFPQVLIIKTPVVASYEEPLCSLGIPHEANKFFGHIKPLYFPIPLAVLLLSHLFLYNIFRGTQEEFLRRAEEKVIQIDAYCVMQMKFWLIYLVLSANSYFFPILKPFVECLQIALIENGRIFSILSPFIVRRILDKTPSE